MPAIQKVLKRAGWSVADVDLFEVNEAFAVVAMIAERDLGIPHDKLNVNGGACALGHPIGASRRADPGHPARGPGGPRRQARRRQPLHRRRRSHRHGGRAGLSAMSNPVIDNLAESRFELTEDGAMTFADYSRRGGALVIPHVETPPAARGQGAASRLMAGIVLHAREQGAKIVPLCPYAAAWLQRHPEHRDLIA